MNFANPPVIAPARYLPRSLSGCAPRSSAGFAVQRPVVPVSSSAPAGSPFLHTTTQPLVATGQPAAYAQLHQEMESNNAQLNPLNAQIASLKSEAHLSSQDQATLTKDESAAQALHSAWSSDLAQYTSKYGPTMTPAGQPTSAELRESAAQGFYVNTQNLSPANRLTYATDLRADGFSSAGGRPSSFSMAPLIVPKIGPHFAPGARAGGGMSVVTPSSGRSPFSLHAPTSAPATHFAPGARAGGGMSIVTPPSGRSPFSLHAPTSAPTTHFAPGARAGALPIIAPAHLLPPSLMGCSPRESGHASGNMFESLLPTLLQVGVPLAAEAVQNSSGRARAGGGMSVVTPSSGRSPFSLHAPTSAPTTHFAPGARAGADMPDWAKLTMAIGIPVLAIGGTVAIVDALANETKAATPIAVAAIKAQSGQPAGSDGN